MQAVAVLGLYFHVAQSDDHNANDIPKPFKSTKGRGGKKSGKGKQKHEQQQQQQQQQQQPPPPPQEEEIKQYDETGNYYHSDNYHGNCRGHRPYRGQGRSRRPYRENNSRGRGQQGNYCGQFQNNRGQYNNSCGGYHNNTFGNYRERGGCSHGNNNYRGRGYGRGNY